MARLKKSSGRCLTKNDVKSMPIGASDRSEKKSKRRATTETQRQRFHKRLREFVDRYISLGIIDQDDVAGAIVWHLQRSPDDQDLWREYQEWWSEVQEDSRIRFAFIIGDQKLSESERKRTNCPEPSAEEALAESQAREKIIQGLLRDARAAQARANKSEADLCRARETRALIATSNREWVLAKADELAHITERKKVVARIIEAYPFAHSGDTISDRTVSGILAEHRPKRDTRKVSAQKRRK
jgi:hypothetical protein